MNSRYYDTPAAMQVIGCVFQNPKLLDQEDKYVFYEEDFSPVEFHRILFGCIYNLHHEQGLNEINSAIIEDYLASREKKLAIYRANKGAEYLENLNNITQLSAFDFYYKRMKKMTLLRMYDNAGMDLKWLYDVDNILDVKKKEVQEEWLNNVSLEEIANIIDDRITSIRQKYINNDENVIQKAGLGARALIERYKENPEIGYPLFGPIINTITRGARLKKFYLRSAATGIGKTRSMIADACFISCDEIYDSKEGKWVNNGTKEPVLYITTEQEIDELQSMMIAFLSDINEDIVVKGSYIGNEAARADYAADLLDRCPLYVKKLPDFSLQDIENSIKRGIIDYGVKYVCFDYIHTSMKILEEITSRAKVNLREDNILFMISTRLKDLCNQYNVFIITATQLNGDYKTSKVFDQNLLRGAKAIADKIDCGMIMLKTSPEDIEALRDVIDRGGFDVPTIKISVYKNRRGRYKDVLLWCKADLGTCRIMPMFVTDYSYELIEISDLQIEVKPDEG